MDPVKTSEPSIKLTERTEVMRLLGLRVLGLGVLGPCVSGLGVVSVGSCVSLV